MILSGRNRYALEERLYHSGKDAVRIRAQKKRWRDKGETGLVTGLDCPPSKSKAKQRKESHHHLV
jgi:hypothetical protein